MPRLTFGQRKLNSILIATFAEMLLGLLLSMTDSAIVGHLIGLEALSAINTIMPLNSLSLFLGMVVSSGASLAYAKEIGLFHREKAHGVFGLSLLIASVFGFLLFLLGILALPVYMRAIGVGQAVAALSREYMVFFSLCLLLGPLKNLLSSMVFCDGGEVIGAASSISNSVGNALFSLLLGWKLGIRGVALGTLLSTLLAFGILSLHLLSRRSSLGIRFSFSRESLAFILRTGLNSDTMFLYFTLLSALCSQITALRFGSDWLPMLTLLYAMIELSVVLESTGEAIKPLTAAYLGSKNSPALRSLLHGARRINLTAGAVMSLLLLISAPWVPYVFHLNTDARLYSVCVRGLRVYAISFLPMAWLALYDSYWLYIGRRRLSFLSNTLKYFLCAAVLIPLLTRFLGPIGLWLSFALAPVLSLLIIRAVGLSHYGRRLFPDFMALDPKRVMDYSLTVCAEEILGFQQKAEDFLRAGNVDAGTVYRVSLAIEELLFLIREKNPGKMVYAECCLRIGDREVSMELWDSGTALDITDTDLQVSSLRSYVLSSLMTVSRSNAYQLSLGLNRCLITFVKREEGKE